MISLIDLGLHLTVFASIVGITSVGVLVLPWSDAELAESARAWRAARSLASRWYHRRTAVVPSMELSGQRA